MLPTFPFLSSFSGKGISLSRTASEQAMVDNNNNTSSSSVEVDGVCIVASISGDDEEAPCQADAWDPSTMGLLQYPN